MVDFAKLLDYFKQKYPSLKEVRYYEGSTTGDEKKKRMFRFLERKGYTICSLERKSYNSVMVEERDVACPKCGHKWAAEFRKECRAMKSNVGVYLASDMVARASITERPMRPMRPILASCDGDYAEAIKTAIRLNDKVSVAVLATPTVRDKGRNTLSIRLKKLLSELPKERYSLNYISAIQEQVKSHRQ